MGKGKKILISLIIILLIIGALFIGFKWQSGPVEKGNTGIVSINIPSGSSSDKISDILEENNLIKSSVVFKLNLKISGKAGEMKAGNYQLNKGMSNRDIIDILCKNKINSGYVTIPEGYTTRQIAERLESKGITSKEDFYNEVKNQKFDYEFLKDAPTGENRLEGFLFPETYDFHGGMSAEATIKTMLSQFDKKFTADMRSDMKKSGLTFNQVVTMASIVQKEAGSIAEMPKIAGVFYNRLKIKMPLQSCSTVQYVLGKTKPRLSIKDTRTKSPYNTYLNKGLPPGPICCPGTAALKAAIHPEKNDYLYFLAKGDGTTIFHKDYNKFLKDKDKYIK